MSDSEVVNPSGEPEFGELEPAPLPTHAEVSAGQQLFGPAWDRAKRYVEHLCTTGITHGLLGPREIPRMWSRHVLNCAVLGPELPRGATVADVGSGSGLPGIAAALTRPDVEFTLIEPMERRVDWLDAVVSDLELENVSIIRARAEDVQDEIMAQVVTARAVSALKKLIPMTVPLLDDGGELIFLKGRSAPEEIQAASKAIQKAKLRTPVVQRLGESILDEPTTVVRASRR